MLLHLFTNSLVCMCVCVCVQEPPPASVVAAGFVLLAGAVTSTVMRRQHEAAELERQQRQIMQKRAEELRAQKAVRAMLCFRKRLAQLNDGAGMCNHFCKAVACETLCVLAAALVLHCN